MRHFGPDCATIPVMCFGRGESSPAPYECTKPCLMWSEQICTHNNQFGAGLTLCARALCIIITAAENIYHHRQKRSARIRMAWSSDSLARPGGWCNLNICAVQHLCMLLRLFTQWSSFGCSHNINHIFVFGHMGVLWVCVCVWLANIQYEQTHVIRKSF